MTRKSYQEELDTLREDVLSMSDLVCDRLRLALQALESKDDALAEEIVTGDHEVNQLYLDLEGDCIDLLALQQPVAGDLRFIASSFKIVTDLERIGDLATNLGRYTLDAERDRYPEIDIALIGGRIVELAEDAMDAYAADDVSATREIAERDDEIDRLCEDASAIVVRDLLERGGGSDFDASTRDSDGPTEAVGGDLTTDDALFGDVSRMLLTIRDLERIGDHAVNIAARTLYMVENDDELIY